MPPRFGGNLTLTQRPNPDGFVPKVGAVRRIRALQAIGHCARDIAAATSLTERDIYLVVNQAGRWITQARWEAVAHAYDQLSMTPGHSSKARDRHSSRLPPSTGLGRRRHRRRHRRTRQAR